MVTASFYNFAAQFVARRVPAIWDVVTPAGALQARLRDGTLVEVPGDGPLPQLDLKPALEGNRKVTVHLGVPLLKSSQPNVAADGPSESNRYYLITQQLDDENLGGASDPEGMELAAEHQEYLQYRRELQALNDEEEPT